MNPPDPEGPHARTGMLERWVRASSELTELLAVARGLDEAAPDILRVLSRLGDFSRALLWTRDGVVGDWTASRVWVRDGDAPEREPGAAAPGGAPALVARVASLRRPSTSQADEARLPTSGEASPTSHALALPILHGETCYGVLELVRPERIVLTGSEETAAGSLGRQIGQFAAREATLRDLVRNRRDLQDLFENAPVGIQLMDAEGGLLRVNRTLMSKLGYARDELVGHLWREFHEDPTVADRLLSRLASSVAAASGPEPSGGEEVRLRRRDGGLLWARVAANALRDEGRIVHVRTFVRDVTAVREAEEALRASEERYRRLVEGARDYALHGLDVEGRVTAWNVGAERLFGYVEADVLHLDFSLSMCVEDRADGVGPRILRLAADEGEFRHEGWRVRKDGSQFWAEVVYSAIRDADGRLVGISQLSRDISERRRLDALRVKSADLLAANHEVLDSSRRRAEILRSVTAAIEGPTAEIEDAAAGIRSQGRAAPKPESYARFDGAVTRLLGAVAGLHDVTSRADAELAPGPDPIDLSRVAAEVRAMLEERAAERRIRIDVDVDPSVDDIRTHADRLRQVLYNLLSNAIRSSRERGLVVMRIVGEGKSGYRIEVHDSGPGLSAPAMAAAFSPAAARPPTLAGGTGEIGLEVTRSIVEAQGGRVSVRSVIGHGSVFVAVLPRRPIEAAMPGADGTSAVAKAPRVLVVAQDPSTRAGLSWALGSSGFEYAVANGVEDGVRAIHDDRFDAVAVDLSLPADGAIEFVGALRRAGASRDAPWILAALGTEGGISCCAVSDLLPSPTPADRMFATLERHRVPRGTGATIVVADADPRSRDSALRTLRLLGYEAHGEAEGEASLRACAERSPAAIILSVSLSGMGPFTFARHARAIAGLERAPLFLALPRDVAADQIDALRRDARVAVTDRSWERRLHKGVGG